MNSLALTFDKQSTPFECIRNGPKTDWSIETIRGFTILLLVGYHAVGAAVLSGDAVPYSPFHHFAFTVDAVIMPWFAVVAGFVYAIKPVKPGQAKQFLANKSKRLLVPLVVMVTLTYLMKVFLPGVTAPLPLHDIWKAYVFSFEHFWFLQALFWVFVVICGLEAASLMKTPLSWAAVTVASLAIPIVVRAPDILSLWGAVYLMPFFLLGCGVRRFPKLLFHPLTLGVAGVMCLAAAVAQQMMWFGRISGDASRGGLMAVALGLSSSILLLRFRRPIRWLSVLGVYSYSIYLMHGFGLAVAKRLADHLSGGMDVQVWIKIGCALLLPIGAQMIISQWKWPRRLALGMN